MADRAVHVAARFKRSHVRVHRVKMSRLHCRDYGYLMLRGLQEEAPS